eukprot:jgi/Psemu1/44395/gm1.44395_g
MVRTSSLDSVLIFGLGHLRTQRTRSSSTNATVCCFFFNPGDIDTTAAGPVAAEHAGAGAAVAQVASEDDGIGVSSTASEPQAYCAAPIEGTGVSSRHSWQKGSAPAAPGRAVDSNSNRRCIHW